VAARACPHPQIVGATNAGVPQVLEDRRICIETIAQDILRTTSTLRGELLRKSLCGLQLALSIVGEGFSAIIGSACGLGNYDAVATRRSRTF